VRGRCAVERKTNDAHFNGTLRSTTPGTLRVLQRARRRRGKAQIFRSREPYSIDAFDVVREENFSYSQAWPVAGEGILWLHTRYQGNGGRRSFDDRPDGDDFSEPKPIADIEQGAITSVGPTANASRRRSTFTRRRAV
jgi:hypothetical protein